ncbi:hypothetical protein Patl1_21949 [Pistacia atlantica]|uniref:Uncharacterized protein n=1 Tax=Pistacia atlantica TaxID=434234 RepID=A0ACC1BNR4_9ROSI|nr:hypothetical protein Patl1_21949 [Pistacia atlantica]
MVKGEAGEKDEQAEEVTCKMIVGRGFGKVVEKIESKSGGGTQVRVFAEDQIPGSGSDELAQITGSFSAVKKTLFSVSSCVQDSPRVDAANTNVTKPPGMLHHGNPMPSSVEPFHQRGYAPGFHWRGYSSGLGPESLGAHNRMYFEEDVVFKLLCHLDKIGSLIGKGDSIVRTFQNETGASNKIADVVPNSDERVVLISARRHGNLTVSELYSFSTLWRANIKPSIRSSKLFVPDMFLCCPLEFRAETLSCSGCCYACGILELLRLDLHLAMLLLLGFLYTHSRLVVNLLGRGGYIISEMRRATGASIHVFPGEQAPKCGARNDEVVQHLLAEVNVNNPG